MTPTFRLIKFIEFIKLKQLKLKIHTNNIAYHMLYILFVNRVTIRFKIRTSSETSNGGEAVVTLFYRKGCGHV